MNQTAIRDWRLARLLGVVAGQVSGCLVNDRTVEFDWANGDVLIATLTIATRRLPIEFGLASWNATIESAGIESAREQIGAKIRDAVRYVVEDVEAELLRSLPRP